MHRINELLVAVNTAKDEAQAAKAALATLQAQQDGAKATVRSLLRKQADNITAAEREALAPQLAEAEGIAAALDARITAARKLSVESDAAVLAAERAHAAEAERLRVEDAAALITGAGRIEVGDRNDSKAAHGGFGSFGARLQAVHQAGMGRPADARLFAGPTGLGETVNSDGGYAVGTDQGTAIMERTYEVGEILKRVKRLTITSNANGIKLPAIDETSRADGSRFGGVRGYWLEEAGTLTATQPKIRQNSLTLKKVGALVYVTDELLQDAGILEQWIMQHLPDELSFKIEDAIVNGDGAGKPLGFSTSDAVVSVSKETGQAAATFTYPNAVKMYARMWARSRSNSVWLINQDVEPQLFQMSLTVGTGGSAVFLPAGGASASPFATLLGRPILPVEYCATLGTAGDVQLVDPTQYTLIDKGGVQIASSMHVQFLTDQMAFRFVMRVDGLPDWNSALTPKNGTNTLSPYIKLATRS